MTMSSSVVRHCQIEPNQQVEKKTSQKAHHPSCVRTLLLGIHDRMPSRSSITISPSFLPHLIQHSVWLVFTSLPHTHPS
ncbi:hypothetical protein VTJ04DRAFT_1130 [Mycothermus thermophilus]|uniref:uncharacterized protein n=1 Tax=Humicola insolens TaxID=85995 RepID=UPI00374475DA